MPSPCWRRHVGSPHSCLSASLGAAGLLRRLVHCHRLRGGVPFSLHVLRAVGPLWWHALGEDHLRPPPSLSSRPENSRQLRSSRGICCQQRRLPRCSLAPTLPRRYCSGRNSPIPTSCSSALGLGRGRSAARRSTASASASTTSTYKNNLGYVGNFLEGLCVSNTRK